MTQTSFTPSLTAPHWPWVYFLLCISYLPFATATYLLHPLHKALPIIMLLMLALCRKEYPVWLKCALAFSVTGDMLIESDFTYGLLAFAAAQLGYAICLAKYAKLTRKGGTLLAGLAAIFLLVMYVVLPAAGAMAGLVLFYAVTLFAMAGCAMVAAPGNRLLIAGAMCFVLSDSLIGVSSFVLPFAYAAELIMVSYYLAQYLLFLGIMELSLANTSRASPSPLNQRT